MKQLKLNIILLLCIMYSSSFSQTILNGSFENNSLPNCWTGDFYFPGDYVNYIENSYPLDADDFQIVIMSDTCHYLNGQEWFPTGVPDGNFGMLLNGSIYENYSWNSGVSLILSESLTIGEEYTLGFYKRKEAEVVGVPAHTLHEPCKVQIGISNNPFDFGEEIFIGEKPSSIEWEQDIFSFTPTFNAQYITVRAIQEDWHHSIFLDNFTFDPKVSVEELNENAFELYPNPVLNTIHIKGDYTGVVKLHSMLGSAIIQQNKTVQQIQLDVSHLPSGIYFLQLGNSVHKIIKE
jgi:hypothetical protein